MHLFITGTDTNIGKTLVSSWLALHTGFAYHKPVQTGTEMDAETIKILSPTTKIYPSTYVFPDPISPHAAAKRAGSAIDVLDMRLPSSNSMLVEGAGGVLVPLTETHLMIDMILHFDIPVLLVTSLRLGTINHTLLTLQALRLKGIPVLGLVTSGFENQETRDALEFYGNVNILGHLPFLSSITETALREIPLPPMLSVYRSLS